MSDRAPYSRVYWSIRDDEKFDAIRGNDHHLATWLRLLIAADMAYPSSADLPATVRKSSVTALVDAELVDLVSGGMFRVRGLTAERERRKFLATTRGPSGDRPGTERVPANETSGHLAKPSLAEQSKAEAPRDPADIYWQLTGKYPAEATLGWIDDLTAKYGAEAVIRHLTAAHISDRSTKTLLGRTTDLLRAEARQLDRKEAATEQAALREKRAKPRILEPWQAEFRASVEQQYRDLEAS